MNCKTISDRLPEIDSPAKKLPEYGHIDSASAFASKTTRRRLLASASGFVALAASGCTAITSRMAVQAEPALTSDYALIYGPLPDERFPIPAIDLAKVPRRFYRRQIEFATPEPIGSIIVDTTNFYLLLVQENGKAMRYGVGLGREGFAWAGRGHVGWKQAWPKWTPPDEMIARKPELAKWSAANGGMPPGLDNPLGARALYIFQGNVDTLYRVHGTPEYWTIGKAVSSGCVRILNHDVIDLYKRVPAGSPILVLQEHSASS